MDNQYILTLSCPDRTGIVAAVSQFIAEHKGWITEASQHGDAASDWFFMRVMIKADSLPFDLVKFEELFRGIAHKFHMRWSIHDTAKKKQVAILVSKFDHCLADLLYRWRSQEFEFDIACVISNHDDCRELVEWHKIPYHQVDMGAQDKTQAYAEIDKLITQYHADTVVLARFMQIIPQDLCEKYYGHMINIHHSFLPSFSGAKPYEQAFNLGVKLIGATCHYVTEELDQGPIIDQDVIRVSHAHSKADLKRLGKDVERRVLAHGVQYHVEDRILIHDNKTIVFSH